MVESDSVAIGGSVYLSWWAYAIIGGVVLCIIAIIVLTVKKRQA